MVERQRGVKSYVRIAKSSIEQVGYEWHRTRPVPVSRPGPSGARTALRRQQKNQKTAIWFQGGTIKFFVSLLARLRYVFAPHERCAMMDGLHQENAPWRTARSTPSAHCWAQNRGRSAGRSGGSASTRSDRPGRWHQM